MKLTPQEELTIQAYSENAVEWVKEHSDTNYWKEELATFKGLLPSGKILEIGCGGGRDAKVLISMGYDYIGTDISSEFVKVAKRLVKNGKFLCKSVYDLGFKDSKFDGFWASAVFLHIPKRRIDEALQDVVRVTRDNGLVFISVKQGKGEPIIEEVYIGSNRNLKLFWAFYHKTEFDKVLKRNNLEVIMFNKWTISKRTTWLIYFVKVVKSPIPRKV